MALSFADALRRMVDLLPWREEAQKLEVHAAISAEFDTGADAGAHAGTATVPQLDESAAKDGTGAAGKADKA